MNKPTVYQVPANPNNYSTASYAKKGIVLHWIVGTLASADATFQNPTRKASTQYGIGASGRIHQYVDDKYTAWHAGVLEYNRYYIGIEHEGGYLVNGQRVKPSPECHQASARLVAWLCKTYNIPCDRKHIIKHSETGYATQCSGSLDIDWIVAEANKLLNPNIMFDYELYVKDNNLFMRIKSGSINEKVIVKNLTEGTSWEVFANKSVGNDGGAINTGMMACLYEVVAKGVVRQYDNRPKPADPCESVKAELAKVKGELTVAQATIASKDQEIKAKNTELSQVYKELEIVKSKNLELEAKLGVCGQEGERMSKELEIKDEKIKELEMKVMEQEQEINNQLPKIEELEAEVSELQGHLETLRTEYQKLAEAYEKCVQNCKGNPEDYKRLIERLLNIIEMLISKGKRGIISTISKLRNGKR